MCPIQNKRYLKNENQFSVKEIKNCQFSSLSLVVAGTNYSLGGLKAICPFIDRCRNHTNAKYLWVHIKYKASNKCRWITLIRLDVDFVVLHKFMPLFKPHIINGITYTHSDGLLFQSLIIHLSKRNKKYNEIIYTTCFYQIIYTESRRRNGYYARTERRLFLLILRNWHRYNIYCFWDGISWFCPH